MASAFPKPGSRSKQQIREAQYPLAITCLQWDGDGALHDDDRDWMLQKLASQAHLASVRAALSRPQQI